MFRQQNESYYRKLVFASSDHPNDLLHPKLEICTRLKGTNIPSVDICDAINQLSFYPNPTDEILHLSLPGLEEQIDITIFDVAGKRVFQKQVNTEISEIDVSFLAPGMYIIEMISENCGVNRLKIMVN